AASAPANEGADRHPDQVEDRPQPPPAPRAEPVEPADRELALLVAREQAHAGQEAPPVLADDLQPAIGPAVALLLVGLEGVGQQAVAVAAAGVERRPTLLHDREAEVGILADRVARPGAPRGERGSG